MRTPKNWTAALTLALVVAACGGDADASGDNPDVEALESVTLGYFANVTHAPAIVGVTEGFFQDELGDVELETLTFNAGTEAIEALFNEAIDMTFIGPNPAVNGFAQSDGEALRIIAGTTSGGAALIVNDDIQSVEDFAGKSLATPSLGNTQDVAARAWLTEQGYDVTLEGGGDVNIVPQANAETLAAFTAGDVQAAWAPEPWSTRLVLEGGGRLFLDEADLWPDGRFVTTHLIVSASFLEDHPDVVDAVLRGLVESVDFVNGDVAAAQEAVSGNIEAITGSAIAPETITGAWANLEFTLDPIASSLQKSAEDAEAAGLLDPVDLDGIYDLVPLNAILTELGLPEVPSS
jgi:NitT/TauT family transport system substrate-binding protein